MSEGEETSQVRGILRKAMEHRRLLADALQQILTHPICRLDPNCQPLRAIAKQALNAAGEELKT